MLDPVDGRRSTTGSGARAATAARPSTETARQPCGSHIGRQPPNSSPLFTSSPHRCTFHLSLAAGASAASLAPVPLRDPLVPHYTFPSYPISPIPPVPFLGCSLDVSDIDGARSIHREKVQRREQSKRQRQPSPTLHGPCQPKVLCPFPPPTVYSLALPSTRLCDPFQPHPFPHRFQYSPNVAQLPCAPFTSTYHPALHDPLPSFDFSIHRPTQLPAHHVPLGGYPERRRPQEATQRQQRQQPRRERRRGAEDGRGKQVMGQWRASAVSARVDCWRESPAEDESDRRTGEWRTFHDVDVALVHTLGLG